MASPNIAFDQLPSSIRKPGKYLEFNTRLAVRTLPANPQRLLILAQLMEGHAAPYKPVQIFDDDQAAQLCGYGSQAHLMARAAITANRYLDLSILPIADSTAGIAATGSITITGAATGAGVMALTIAGEQCAIVTAAADTAAAVALALQQAVNDLRDCPVKATAEEGVLTLTAKNKGTLGNSIGLDFAHTVPGLTCTLLPMSGGQQDPDITDALATVFSGDYQLFCIPWATQEALTALRNHLEAVAHPLEQRGAVGIAASTGTLAAATTLASSINSGRITLALLPGSTTHAPQVAAAYAAVVASEEDPARPLNTLELKSIAVPNVESRLSRNEQEVALKNGVTPLEVGPGDKVLIVRAISTYTVNAEGVNDIALLDITTIRTLDYVRKSVRERISLRFPREKLSSRTPPKVRSEILDVLRLLEELEILEEVAANAEGVICERDTQDPNRLNAKIPADVVNGLHVFAGRIDLLL